MKLVIVRMTKKNQVLQVFVDDDGKIIAKLDGVEIGTDINVWPFPYKMRPTGLDPQYTSLICGKVVLTSEEADKLKAETEAIRIAKVVAHKAKLDLNVPGLATLRAALDDESRYHRQFNRMMEDENNDGARPPKSVKVKYSEIAPQFPRAAVYLKAEGYFYANHYAKSAAGKQAMELIENGGDLAEAQKILDNWLPAEAWNN